MKVAVITPYHLESDEVLRQCHRSVLSQSLSVEDSCTHIVVADGHPGKLFDNETARHITLPHCHNDNGNTPRSIGSLYAINQGFDAIAYLDADNWYQPNHIASLINAQQQHGSLVCASARSFHRADGSEMHIREATDGHSHLDTSCLFLTQDAFRLCNVWAMMPKFLSPICDRIFFYALSQAQFEIAYTGQKTLAFRSQYASHYRGIGEPPPEGAKGDVFSEPVARWHALSDTHRRMYFQRLGFSFSFEKKTRKPR